MLQRVAVQEHELLYVVDEVGDALILVPELRQFLLQVSHWLFFHILFVIDAGTAGTAGLELHQPLLMPLLAPALQL